MDGFKNTTKMSYDTASGRKFASGGMMVSRNDTVGGEAPMSKPAMVAKYAKGGSVKGAAKIAKVMGEFAEGKLHSGSKKGPEVKNPKQAMAIAMSEAKSPMKKAYGGYMDEGISTRPTDDSGRRITNEELGMTLGGVDTAKKKAMPKGMGAMSNADKERAKKKAMPKAMSDLDRARAMVTRPMGLKKGGVPAHSDRPMIRRGMGGLSVMPKGGKC